MKKLLVTFGVATLAAAPIASTAADIMRGPQPYYSSPPPMNYYNWAGFYAGLNAGYELGKVTNFGADPSGIAGGAQVGFNWQSGQFVFGGEADVQASGADDTFAAYKFSNPWFGTLRVRLGYALNNILLYGTGGFAFGDLTGDLGPLSETHTLTGWTGGIGMEIGFARNWSAKAEYLYMDLGSANFAITGANNGFQASLLRFGINYHF
jgi:outer membrane immunogenic protein